MAEKLVRDNIPMIISANNESPSYRIAAPDEMPTLLQAKLQEEVQEYVSSEQPEELADILEVLYALAYTHGLSIEDLELMRRRKATRNGAFNDRIVLTIPKNP